MYRPDEGEYMCLASNEAGQVETCCELKVTLGKLWQPRKWFYDSFLKL